MINRQAKYSPGSNLILVFLIVLGVNLAIYLNFSSQIIAATALLCLIPLADLVLFRKTWLLPSIIFLIPLSIKLELGSVALSTPAEPMIAVTAGIVLFYLIHKSSPDRKILLHPVTLLLLADTLWLIFASFLSTSPMISAKRVIIRICFLLVFYFLGTFWFKKSKNIPYLFGLYGLGLLLPAIFILKKHAAYNFQVNLMSYSTPPFFDEHTVYGACVAFLLPFLVVFLLNQKYFNLSIWQKRIGGILLILTLIVTVESFSRAAWLSLLVAGGVHFLIQWKFRLRGILGLLGMALLAGWLMSDTLMQKIQRNEAISHKGDIASHIQSVSNVETDASNVERINRWISAFRMFEEKPWTGFGPGTYQFEYGSYQPTEYMTYLSTFEGDKGNAHSEYLTYLSETGLPGMLIFLFLLLTVLHTGLQTIYTAKSVQVQVLAKGVLLSLVTWVFHGLFNSFIDQDKMAVLIFGSMAALVALNVYHQQTESHSQNPSISG